MEEGRFEELRQRHRDGGQHLETRELVLDRSDSASIFVRCSRSGFTRAFEPGDLLRHRVERLVGIFRARRQLRQPDLLANRIEPAAKRAALVSSALRSGSAVRAGGRLPGGP